MAQRAALAISTLLALPAFAASLPADVAARFAAVVHPARSPAFVGSYTVSTSTVLSGRDGTPIEQVRLTIRVERGPGGSRTASIERAEENGADVTGRMRAAFAGGRPAPGHGDVPLVTPFGPDAPRYAVSAPRTRGKHLEADFRPRSGQRGAGLARGTLAWDPSTRDPLWARYELLEPASELREMALRFDFARQGDTMFVTHVWVQGTAGRGIFARLYDMDLKVTEIRPESPLTAGAR